MTTHRTKWEKLKASTRETEQRVDCGEDLTCQPVRCCRDEIPDAGAAPADVALEAGRDLVFLAFAGWAPDLPDFFGPFQSWSMASVEALWFSGPG
ncbi:hypothetical protein [Burkholderia ubonensis]|uniref:hypothetical protein n=1 Tax=Burkholderia ubonensis TaxID=101571 RepID=UPI0012F867D8|nr:hypothetical protein [Burkholderia ubonensis]